MSNRYVARHDLPDEMSLEIGRLIVAYAYVEQYLQAIIYSLLSLDRGLGRLAVREPCATQRLDLIRDLLAARKLEEPGLNLKELRDALQDAEDMRNVCAHSSWVFSDERRSWVAVVERGQWADVPKANRARKNKRIHPEGQVLSAKEIKSYVLGTIGIATRLRKLQEHVAKQIDTD